MNTNILRSIFGALAISLWLVVSGYLCVGSLVFIESLEKVKSVEKKLKINITSQISYANKEDHSRDNAKIVIERIKKEGILMSFADEEAIRDFDYAHWYYTFAGYSYISFIALIPYFALIFLGAGAAGTLGSAARIISDHVREVKPVSEAKVLSFPAFGFFMGIMVLAISFVIPTIFVRGESSINFTSTVLVGFFAGMFSEAFFEKIQNLASNTFKSS